VECVIYSSNKDLSKEEALSNCTVAQQISKILSIPALPVNDIKCLKSNFTKVFNLCDNDENTGTGLFESAQELERKKIQFTGASSNVLRNFVNKELWLRSIHNKITTPNSSFFNKQLATPVILKNKFSHGSCKMTSENILHDIPTTISEKNYLEEFIEGEEFSYCEVPGLFEASIKKEIEKNKICDFYFKWKKETVENCKLVEHDDMRCIVSKIKKHFNITSYFRIDYRIRDDKIYIFDINPNCYLGTNGTLMKAAYLCGKSHADVVAKIYA
jgi:predicted ATP-grasp superfamily ATP-dependent carboligase